MPRTSISLGSVVLATGAWLVLSAPAMAGGEPGFPPSPFSPAPRFGAPSVSATPPVARYTVEGSSFTLDTSGPVPLMRYSNSVETFALRPQPAPRGDTLFLNDAGDTVLRATRLGGLIAFTPSKPEGAAAAVTGPATPLGLPDIRSAAQVSLRIYQSSDRISRLSGREIGLDAQLDRSGPEAFPLLADAVAVTVEAFSKVTQAQYVKRKKTWVQSLGIVKYLEGEPPRAYVDKDALVVVITPARGIAGRPSSLRIVKALTR